MTGSFPEGAAMDRIEFYKHDLGDAEIASVAETLRSLFLTLGPRVRGFRAGLRRFPRARARGGRVELHDGPRDRALRRSVSPPATKSSRRR